jgi:hypothetical protein
MNLRHLVERFSRGVILRRHLPRQFQNLPLYVSPDAGFRYWRWGVETADPMLFRMVRELVRPGSVVWDVGGQRRLIQFQRRDRGSQRPAWRVKTVAYRPPCDLVRSGGR